MTKLEDALIASGMLPPDIARTADCSLVTHASVQALKRDVATLRALLREASEFIEKNATHARAHLPCPPCLLKEKIDKALE